MMPLGTDSRQTPLKTLSTSVIEPRRRVRECGSRREVIAHRDGLAQSGGIGSIEQMEQRNRPDFVTRHLQRASALALRCGFGGKGLEHPHAISVHGAGPRGESYLVYASVDISAPLRSQGFDTWMCAVQQNL